MIQKNRAILAEISLSSSKYREWQRYRGWKLKILEELEHSGGMTTREISTRVGYSAVLTSNTLCKMVRSGLVEKVERWGWKITRDGITCITINYSSTTYTQHNLNSTTSLPQEKEQPAPICFNASTCHIKRFCSDKRFISKNTYQCDGCTWNTPEQWNKPKLPVEKKEAGGTQAPLVQERLQPV